RRLRPAPSLVDGGAVDAGARARDRRGRDQGYERRRHGARRFRARRDRALPRVSAAARQRAGLSIRVETSATPEPEATRSSARVLRFVCALSASSAHTRALVAWGPRPDAISFPLLAATRRISAPIAPRSKASATSMHRPNGTVSSIVSNAVSESVYFRTSPI